MRHGDKLASYRLLAAALADLLDLPWSLDIVGDGAARAGVESALEPLGTRIRYRGELDEAAIAAALAEADLFVWPAVNEAFGMALLEAQASGLPVVAGASGGVAGIVASGETGQLVPPGELRRLIRAKGRVPAERTSLYALRNVYRSEADDAPSPLDAIDDAAARFGSYEKLAKGADFRFRAADKERWR